MSSIPPGTTLPEGGLQSIILYEFGKGSSEEATATEINRIIGEGYVSEATVHHWFCRFNAGNFSLEDEGECEELTRKRPAGEEACESGGKKQHHMPTEITLANLDDIFLKRVVEKEQLNQMPVLFENIRKLEVAVEEDNVQTYCTSRKIFDLVRNQKTIEVKLDTAFKKEVIQNFLDKWRQGESTRSLEKLKVLMGTLDGSEDAFESDARRRIRRPRSFKVFRNVGVPWLGT